MSMLRESVEIYTEAGNDLFDKFTNALVSTIVPYQFTNHNPLKYVHISRYYL